MDTNALKKFAQAARNLLIDQVTSKLDLVLVDGSAAWREHPQAMKDLDAAIAREGSQQVIEQVAYIWFNRFTALRFMDANDYTSVGIVSPADGQTRPEILSEAMAGNFPEDAPERVVALLDGRIPSSDPQAEAYRLLLVHACNQWHGPMPFLFEQIDDYSELLMPEDLLSQTSILAEVRAVMTHDACQDVEIIGWLYQFYISEKKDQVFAGLKKNVKVTAENIPAATQLFTPHWIVRYLVENSLGRLWLLNRPDSKLTDQMDYYIAPEEPETDFLRISRPEDIRICDPAAGSGHMLTYAFDLLYAIYEEEGYDATEIPALILTYNLTGVEIDDRAGALAAFALVMKAAARLGRRRFLRMEAKPDICVLQNVSFTEAEMQDVAAVVGKDLFTDELRETLLQFEQAKNFGSLIVPKLRDPAETLRVVEARDFGGDLLLKEVQERVIAVLRMAEALSPKYHVVVANPPYMGAGGMNDALRSFAENTFNESKFDLYSMFIDRNRVIVRNGGLVAMITMQGWMFLSRLERQRCRIVQENKVLSVAHLGSRAFDSIGGEVVSTAAFILQTSNDLDQLGDYFRLTSGMSEAEKSSLLLTAKAGKNSGVHYRVSGRDLEKIPGDPLAYWVSERVREIFEKSETLGSIGSPTHGVVTGDNDRFLRQWSEVSTSRSFMLSPDRQTAKSSSAKWFPVSKGGSFRRWHGNLEFFIDWENDGHVMRTTKHSTGRIRATNFNLNRIFQPGITWSTISNTLAMRYLPDGMIFESKGSVCFSDEEDARLYLLALTNSKVVNALLLIMSPTLDYHEGPMSRVPVVDMDHSRPVTISSELRCVSKQDWDAYETSWDFTTLPLLQPDHRAKMLEATYTTLRAHWQGMTDEMQRLEEENNRIFIDAYGLQDELTPEVPLNEITLTCNPAYRYGIKNDTAVNEARLRADTMAEYLSYAVGCMFGRYSLDAPGLILANQGETLADYLARIPDPQFMPDEDNVIPVLDADWFPDDITERFRLFLRATFGEEKFRENLRFIEDALGKDIRKYFTKDFYADHVKRYKKRPIYWLFASPKGSFQALIYMHRYRSDTVSVVLNDYLREYISKLEAERGRLEKLSDDASASQAQRTKALKDMAGVGKQIEELNAWERDVVFPMAQQKIEIDLDDGVKANYPKFGTALKKIPGLEAKND